MREEKWRACVGLLPALRRNADVNAVCDFDGDMVLHRAVREGHSEVVSLLLEYGAGKDHKNLEGFTPVELAQRKKKSAVIAALAAPSAPRHPSRGPEGAMSPPLLSESETESLEAMRGGGGAQGAREVGDNDNEEK